MKRVKCAACSCDINDKADVKEVVELHTRELKQENDLLRYRVNQELVKSKRVEKILLDTEHTLGVTNEKLVARIKQLELSLYNKQEHCQA